MAITDSAGNPSPAPQFARSVLQIGFFVGLLLATVCLAVCAWYLISGQAMLGSAVERLLQSDPHSRLQPQQAYLGLGLELQMYVARMLVVSSGIFVGMAFGFLGFSLFLIGVQGEMDANVNGPQDVRVTISRLSPGMLTILISAVLVGLCALHNVDLTLGPGTTAGAPPPQKPSVSGSARPSIDKLDSHYPGGDASPQATHSGHPT